MKITMESAHDIKKKKNLTSLIAWTNAAWFNLSSCRSLMSNLFRLFSTYCPTSECNWSSPKMLLDNSSSALAGEHCVDFVRHNSKANVRYAYDILEVGTSLNIAEELEAKRWGPSTGVQRAGSSGESWWRVIPTRAAIIVSTAGALFLQGRQRGSAMPLVARWYVCKRVESPTAVNGWLRQEIK